MFTACSKSFQQSYCFYIASSHFLSSFHRHFLLKTGTGTTSLFTTPNPGYTMATGAVYSPPARPLTRNTLSRGAFKFNKSPKRCSWKCTALSAVGVATLLSVLLCYCIGNCVCVSSLCDSGVSCFIQPVPIRDSEIAHQVEFFFPNLHLWPKHLVLCSK